jgi:hypothetical protein
MRISDKDYDEFRMPDELKLWKQEKHATTTTPKRHDSSMIAALPRENARALILHLLLYSKGRQDRSSSSGSVVGVEESDDFCINSYAN